MKYRLITIVLILQTWCVIQGCGPRSAERSALVLDFVESRWDSSLVATYEFGAMDTLSLYEVNLLVRHDQSFEKSKLRLEVKTTTPSMRFWTDTLELSLTNGLGKWQGRQFADYVDYETLYRTGVRFSESGRYIFAVRYLEPGVRVIESIDALAIIINGKK